MKIITKNKFAYSNYEVKETYDTGIVLKGYEVKSVKGSKVNIKDAIIKIIGSEIFITNMDIALYEKTSPNIAKGYESKGMRKLLMKRKEINRLGERINKTGFVLIPLSVYISNKGLIKIQIGLAKLLKKIEKKQVIKEKDIQRQAQREIRDLKI